MGPKLGVEKTVAKFREIYGLRDPDAENEPAESEDVVAEIPPPNPKAGED